MGKSKEWMGSISYALKPMNMEYMKSVHLI